MSAFLSSTKHLPKFISTLNNKRREGTKNQGIDYELKICALVALRAAIAQDGLSDFWMTQNVIDPKVGLFDDVVLVLERSCGQTTVYCIQLKHFSGKKRRNKLTFSALQQEGTKNNKNTLFLDDYFDSIQKVVTSKENLSDSSSQINYILFTNRPKDKNEKRYEPLIENGDIQIIDTGGNCFRLTEYESLNAEKHFDENLLNNFALFADQAHEEHVEKIIETTLASFVELDADKLKNVLDKYLKHVTDWIKGNLGGDRFLCRDEMRFKLCEFVLNCFTFAFPTVLTKVPDDILDKWDNIVSKYKAVIVENCQMAETFQQCCSMVLNSSNRIIKQYLDGDRTKKPFCKILENCDEEINFLWGEESLSTVNEQILQYYLWKKNVLPLVVRVDKEADLLQLLQMCCISTGKIIFLYTGSLCEEFRERIRDLQGGTENSYTHNSILHSFANLSRKDKKLLSSQEMVFQGRKVTVGEVISDNQLESQLLAEDIIKILLEDFNVGTQFLNLPKIFISRCFSKTFIDPNVFQQNIAYVIMCQSEDVFSQYVQKSSTKLEHENVVTLIKSDKITERFAEISVCKSSQIVLSIGHKLDSLQQCINALNTTKSSSFQIFDLREHEDALHLVPIDFIQTTNVILNEAIVLENFLRRSNVSTNQTEIYEFSQLNYNCIPVNCRYIMATEEEAKSLKVYRRNTVAFHFYKIRQVDGADKLHLEFLGSFGASRNLDKFIKHVKDSLLTHSTFDFTNCFHYNDVNIINGSPGMGKSVLINYLMKICPSNCWIVFINFNIHLKYFTQSDLDATKTVENLKYFFDYTNLNQLERTVFDRYLEAKRLCVFCDGYDEIQPKLEDKVCTFLNQLIANGFVLFVTTRTVKVDLLKSKLNSTSRSIVPFDRDDQFEYLSKYYASKVEEDAKKIQRFVENLLTMTSTNLSAWDLEFSGVPLQTLMISEIYLDECKKYCTTNVNTLQNNVDVLSLYKHFIDYKISNLKIKDNIDDPKLEFYFYDNMERSLDSHKLCAIRAIFSCENSEVNVKNFVRKVKERKDKIGLIDRFLEDDTPVFVHRTFAEYLAALYISENFRNSFVKDLVDTVLKNSVYDVIRQVLDRLLLSDKCCLHRLLLNGNVEDFKDLARDKSTLRVKDDGGRTVLHLAMSWGKRHDIPGTEVIDELADIGDWASFQNKFGSIFEAWKRQRGSEKFISVILSNNSDLNELLYETDDILNATPFDYGSKVTALTNLDLYLGKVMDSDGNFDKLKSSAETWVDHETIKRLLLSCAMFDYRYVTSIVMKLRPSTCDVGEVTLGKYNIAFLHVAAMSRADKVICELTDAGVNVNVIETKKNRSPLHFAALRGNVSTVKLLLERGADVTLLDWSSRSPLYLAKWGRHEEIVQLLTIAEDLVGGKRTKITELFVASVAGELEKVRSLLEAGADPNEMSDGGGRPLMEASAEGHLEIVQLLLRFGADVNATTHNNWTSLMWACMRGHEEVARLLLSSGADVHKISRFSDTALSLTVKHGQEDIEQLLRSYGA